MLRSSAAQLARRTSQLVALGTRGLAQAAEEIKLPAQHGVPGRYAAALYMAALKSNTLDKVETELSQVATLLQESRDFSNFVNDPSVERKTKVDGLNAVLGKMGASDVTRNFVGLLSDNNRLRELEKIVEKFGEIAAEQRGEVRAQVTSAEGLTQDEVDELKHGLAKLLKPGQKLALEEKVDPSIIGGVIIDVGDKHVDLSILSRVKKLQQIVREAV